MPEQAFLVSRGEGKSHCFSLYFCPLLKQVLEGRASVARSVEARLVNCSPPPRQKSLLPLGFGKSVEF